MDWIVPNKSSSICTADILGVCDNPRDGSMVWVVDLVVAVANVCKTSFSA